MAASSGSTSAPRATVCGIEPAAEEARIRAPSPATLYATVAGVLLTIAGIAGFFYSASFGSPGDVGELLGTFAVNGWDNVLHLVTGLVALVAAGYAARRWALVLGLLYLVLGVWGLIVGDGDSIADILPVSTADNIVHLLLGLAGIAAALATPRNPSPVE
jgi:hypothetical protein